MDEERKALALFRIEKAKNDLHDAQETLRLGMYDNAANRSSYAIFHAARAVLALDGLDFKKHAGVVGTFSKNYIKTGIFDPSMAKMIKSAFSIRSETDYEDFYVVSKSDVEQQVSDAGIFVSKVEEFINKKRKEHHTMKYVCDACGWEYDEALGDPDNGIAPGTKFEDLPEDFECPVCGVGKDMFSEA